jgi:hypothetical protein
MAIHLDENGKPSATRAVVFSMILILASVVVADVWFGKQVFADVYDTIEKVLLVLVGAMATRSAVKHVTDGRSG